MIIGLLFDAFAVKNIKQEKKPLKKVLFILSYPVLGFFIVILLIMIQGSI